MLSVPLFLSVLPSITLAGVPDHDADKEAGKRTIAVRLGKKGAAKAAIVFTILAAVSVALFTFFGPVQEAVRFLLIPVSAHAAWLCYKLKEYLDQPVPEKRIDGLMVLSLAFILWFGLIPLINLSV